MEQRKFLICGVTIAAVLATSVATAKNPSASVVFEFEQVQGAILKAEFDSVEIRCSTENDVQTVELRIVDPKKFHEIEQATESAPEGAKPLGLRDLVEDALRNTKDFKLVITPAEAKLRREEREPVKVAGTPEMSADSIKLEGYFIRTDLGLGNVYRSDDPLSLREEIGVEVLVECP